MTDQARIQCPVCGRAMTIGPLQGHVGSASCVMVLHINRGKHHDPVRGPVLLDLCRKFHDVLMEKPTVP